MSVKLICVSHTPLLNFASPPEEVKNSTYASFQKLANEVQEYDPTLIIVYGPDHFNGFFYELMPSFCLGIRAQAAGDWNYGPGPINVPETKAIQLLDYCLDHGIDLSYSYRMQIDHGFTQPLHLLCNSQLGQYPVIPIFINCAAEPLPKMSRVIEVGRIIGNYLKTLDERILIIGTGGLSHDPPTPSIRTAPPEVQEFLIAGRNPTPEARAERQNKIVAVGQQMVDGDKRAALPLNSKWDKELLEKYSNADFEYFAKMTTSDIRINGGRGGQEIRTWSAAFASLAAFGEYNAEVIYYDLIPEWLVAMGMMKAEPK